MKRFTVYVVFFCITVSCTLRAQIPALVPRTAQIPEAYKANYEKEIQRTAYFTKAAGITGNEADYVNYRLATAKVYSLGAGEIYYNWKQAEDYLNDIMKLLVKNLGDSLPYAPHVYLSFDATFNAFAIHDGSLFFNIGSFLHLDNEAEVASILAHELAHFLKQHAVQSVLASIREDYNSLNSYRKKKEYRMNVLSNSRQQESEADSIGFMVYARSGYEPDFYISAHEKLNAYEKSFDRFFVIRLMSKFPTVSTHPPGEERVAFTKRQIDKLTNTSGASFMVSDVVFSSIKKQARIECMEEFLSNGDYILCMEMAFTNYIQDTSDNNNVHYLIESLRKYCFSSGQNKSSVFLSSLYFARSYLLPQNPLLLKWSTPSVMERLDIIFPADKINTLVQDTFLLHHPKEVHTCRDAFSYFEKIAARRNMCESFLSMALHYERKDKKFDDYLAKYLSFSNCKYREYATWLKDARDHKPLKTGKSAVVLNFHIITELINDVEVYGYLDYETLEKDVYALLQEECAKKGRVFFSTTQLMQNNIEFVRSFQLFDQIISNSVSSATGFAGTKSSSVFYFDPVFYYEFIHKQKYDEIIFVDVFDKVEILPDRKTPIASFNEVDFLRRNIWLYKLKQNPDLDFTRDKFGKSAHRMQKF